MPKRIALIAISALVVAYLFQVISTRQLRAVAQEKATQVQLERAVPEDAGEPVGVRKDLQLVPFRSAEVVNSGTPTEAAGVAQPANAVPQPLEPDAVDSAASDFENESQSVRQVQLRGGSSMMGGIARKSLQIQSFRLKNLRASNVKEMLGLLFPSDSQRGPFYASEPTGNILVIKGEATALSEITQLLRSLGESGRPNAMSFQNATQQPPPGSPSNRNPLGTSGRPGGPGRNDAHESQQQLNAHVNLLEAQARLAAAVNQQQVESSSARTDEIAALKEKLRSMVAEEFQLRQELQQRDLELLRRRLEAVEDRLQRREQMQDRIIDARIRELLSRKSDRKDDYGRMMMSMMQDDEAVDAAGNENRAEEGAEEATRADDDSTNDRNELIRRGFATQFGRGSSDPRFDLNLAEDVDRARQQSRPRLEADLEIRRRLGEAEIALRQITTRMQRLEKLFEAGNATVEELEETQLEQERAALAHEELRRLSEYQKQQSNFGLRYAEKSLQLVEQELAQVLDVNAKVKGAVPPSEIDRLRLKAEKAKLQYEQAKRLQLFLNGEDADSKDGSDESVEQDEFRGGSHSMLDRIMEYGKSVVARDGALEIWRAAASLGDVAADSEAREDFFQQKSRAEKQLTEILSVAEDEPETDVNVEDAVIEF